MSAPNPIPAPKRGHVRNFSADERRVSVPRRPTIGPLDLEETLEENPRPPPPPKSLPPSRPTSQMSSQSPSQIHVTTRDFAYLLNPQNFHPLPSHALAAPFRNSPTTQPPPTASLQELLATLHFRAAAITAANLLSSPETSPHDYETIFKLFYIRLSCLTLIGSTTFAAQEVKHLSDLSSNFYRDENGVHLVPWELRVLAVRLQAIAFSDWRRSIGLYYELAREARVEALKATEMEDVGLWRRRLKELGIRVGSALVEMGDLAGAGRHLESLRYGEDDSLKGMLALLYIRIGNLEAARKCFETMEGGGEEENKAMFPALLLMAEAKWSEAVEAWKPLEGDMARNNEAVCLLYTGKLKEAREILESLVDEGNSFQGLTFNLSTIYELCSDNSKALKIGLAERVAGHGKEMTNASFKM